MTSTIPQEEIYRFLAQRRSASIMVEPKPNAIQLTKILEIAGTVPDHGSLKPFRFAIIEEDARETFGLSLIDAAAAHRQGGIDEGLKPKIKAKAFAAPLQILIIFSPVQSPKVPRWEQMASASCTGYALGLAANALGFGAVWKNFAYDPGPMMKKIFDLKEGEEVLGWVNIGTDQDRDRSEREPLDVTRHVMVLK